MWNELYAMFQQMQMPWSFGWHRMIFQYYTTIAIFGCLLGEFFNGM